MQLVSLQFLRFAWSLPSAEQVADVDVRIVIARGVDVGDREIEPPNLEPAILAGVLRGKLIEFRGEAVAVIAVEAPVVPNLARRNPV